MTSNLHLAWIKSGFSVVPCFWITKEKTVQVKSVPLVFHSLSLSPYFCGLNNKNSITKQGSTS